MRHFLVAKVSLKYLIHFFVNVVSNLGIVINESVLGNTGETNDLIVNIIERYKTHPSIRLLKEHATQLDN